MQQILKTFNVIEIQFKIKILKKRSNKKNFLLNIYRKMNNSNKNINKFSSKLKKFTKVNSIVL